MSARSERTIQATVAALLAVLAPACGTGTGSGTAADADPCATCVADAGQVSQPDAGTPPHPDAGSPPGGDAGRPPGGDAGSLPPAAGFTTIVDSADTIKIYVSSSAGDDANDGLSEASAKRTLRAGYLLLRDGSADQLLLKRGDEWLVTDPENRFVDESGQFSKTGRAFELTGDRRLSGVLLLGAYGAGPRPKILVRRPSISADPIVRWVPWESRGNVAVVGLHFEAAPGEEWVNGIGAMSWQGGDDDGVNSSGFLIEDCRFTRLDRGYSFGDFTRIQIRRNVFEDIGNRCAVDLASFSPTMGWIGSGEGRPAYQQSKDILIEENYYLNRFFDRTRYPNNREPYIQDSALYLAHENLQPVVVRRNVFINKGEFGHAPAVQMRPGGIMADNLISGFSMAGGGPIYLANASPVENRMTGNVVLDGVHLRHYPVVDGGGSPVRTVPGCDANTCDVACNMIPGDEIEPRAVGLGIGSPIKDGHSYVIDGNIIAHKKAAGGAYGLNMDPGDGEIRNVRITRNILFNWNGIGTWYWGPNDTSHFSDVTIEGNELQSPDAPGNEEPLIRVFGSAIGTFAGNTFYTSSADRLFDVGGDLDFAAYRAAVEPTATWSEIAYPDPYRDLSTYSASIGLGASLDALMDLMLEQSRDHWDDRVAIDPILAYIRAGFGR